MSSLTDGASVLSNEQSNRIAKRTLTEFTNHGLSL